MLQDIVAVELGTGTHLHLRFEDGVEGDVDIAEVVRFAGVFSALQDPREFARVRVDPETGTICWPNGADLDPVVLYARIKGVPVSVLVAGAAPDSRGDGPTSEAGSAAKPPLRRTGTAGG